MLFLLIGVLIPLVTTRGSQERLQGVTFDSRMKRIVYFGNSLFLWGLALLALFVWWINDRSWASLGLVWPPPRWDTISCIVAAIFGVLYIADSVFDLSANDKREEIKKDLSDSLGFLPVNWREYAQYSVLALSAGICEEIVFRGYFIRYLQLFFGENDYTYTLAILVAALIFALVHLYQGWEAVAKVAGMAVMFGFIFIRVESLFGLMLIHAGIDLVGGAVAWYVLSNKNQLDESNQP